MIVFLNVNFNCIKFLIAFWACRRYQKPGKQDKTSTPSGCSLQSLRPQRFSKPLGLKGFSLPSLTRGSLRFEVSSLEFKVRCRS